MQCLNDLNGTPDEFQPYLTSPSLSPRSCEDQGWLCSLGMHHTKTKSPFPPEKKMPRHIWVRLRIVYSFNPTGSLIFLPHQNRYIGSIWGYPPFSDHFYDLCRWPLSSKLNVLSSPLPGPRNCMGKKIFDREKSHVLVDVKWNRYVFWGNMVLPRYV